MPQISTPLRNDGRLIFDAGGDVVATAATVTLAAAIVALVNAATAGG